MKCYLCEDHQPIVLQAKTDFGATIPRDIYICIKCAIMRSGISVQSEVRLQ